MNVLRSLKGLVDALFAPAEDPRKTLAYTYHHQSELLGKVRDTILNMQTARGRLVEKIETVKERGPELEAEARGAVAQGDEPRARFALQRRQIAQVELEGLEAQLADVELEQQRLTRIEQRLSMQIEALLARQELINARHSAAEAQVYINQEIGTVSEELAELDVALAQAEARAERLQQRASALDQMAAANMTGLPGQASLARVQENIQRLQLGDAVEEAFNRFKREQANRPDKESE